MALKSDRVSVIVSSYNRPDMLRLALLSLNHQSLIASEVLVADDGSHIDMVGPLQDILPELSFSLRFVTHPDKGFRLAKARNNGVRSATGDFLIFTDQDIVLTKHYVRNMVEQREKSRFLVSFPVRLTEAQTARVTEDVIRGCQYDGIASDDQRSQILKQHRKDLFYRILYSLRLRPIGPKLRGGVFAVAKEDYLAVNGFDENFQGWGNEDDDLGHRLYRIGVRGINVTRDEFPIHLHHPSHGTPGARPNREYYLERLREIRKGDFRCRYGIETPLGGDESVVTTMKASH